MRDYLSLDGDTMHEGNTGIDMNQAGISNLTDPVADQDAVNKRWYKD